MKKLLTILILLPLFAFAQDHDGVIANAADRGMTFTLGRGTMPNGDFAYIGTSGASWLTFATVSSNGSAFSDQLPGSFGGLVVTVKKKRKLGNRRVGFKTIAIVGVGNIVNYQVDIYGAVHSGEIVAVNGHPINKEGQFIELLPKAATPKPQPDKAQKLLEWTKVLNAGGISQHEYDSIKTSLLNQ